MKRITSISFAAMIIWLSLAPACAAAGAPLVSFFPATGHQVQGDFLDYFRTHGGEVILGKPLTEEFIAGGMTVQAFEQAVIERPLGAPASAIRLRAIGEKLGKSEPRLPSSAIPSEEAARSYFPATGHAVCSAFLGFFEANGGAAFLGYPISGLRVEEGITVQYFQNVSLQWQQRDRTVRLGPLGELYLRLLDLPESLLRPVQPLAAAAPASADRPTPCPSPELPQASSAKSPVKGYIPKLPMLFPSSNELQVAATVRYSRTGLNGTQTLYVQVRNRSGERVAYAQVDMIVRAAGGLQRAWTLRTDPAGRASLTFDIGNLPEGRVVIDARAAYGRGKGLGQTTFVLSR